MNILGVGIKLTSKLTLLLAIIFVFFFLALRVFAATTVDVKFVNHIDANLAEQDVFIVSKDDPTQVVRVEGETAKDPTVLSQKVYASSEAVAHDPFKLGATPLGPFPKGLALGTTLEQWLMAKGTGTYTVDGDTAILDLIFEGLMPEGVYTVWCSRLTFPPNPQIVDRPCGAEDGSQNSFTAFKNGAGEFKLTMKPMEESTQQTASVFALAYHSDGKTYGVSPGDFGLNSHVQLFFMIPPAQAAESPVVVATATPAPTMLLGLSQTTWIVIVVVIVLLVLGWWWYSRKTPPSTPQTPTSEV